MGETCKRCGRAIWKSPQPGNNIHWCTEPGGRWCSAAAEGRRIGMREGVELAKERAKADSWDSRYLVWERIPIDWTDADAELERRLRGAE